MSKSTAISKIDGLIVRKSGPWIKRKYYYLNRYCEIFTKAMRKKWHLTFIDLFAGSGRCLIESTKEDLEGSALLSLQYDFSKYVFVEANKKSFQALKQRCHKSPKRSNITFLNGDCNKLVEKIADSVRLNSLSLIFADPTGIDIHFETIEKLVRNQKADLLLNIQFGMDIKRNFKNYVKRGDKSPLGLFLGSGTKWNTLKNPRDVVKLYRKRIHDLGYETVEFKDIDIRNTKNAPMYFLFFAAKHKRGLDFWKKITTKDSSGQYELF